jgi:transposase
VEQVTTIGLDIAKTVFQAHGASACGGVVFRKKISRSRLLAFFASVPSCTIAMEACGGAHHWAREFGKLGHTIRLIPAAYVKPFVRRHKNDAADAEAICEAAQRPSMRFVPVKSEAQRAGGTVFRARDLLVRQRTQCINALRGHLTEYGWIVPKGVPHVTRLIARIEDPDEPLPERARAIFRVLIATLKALDEQIAILDVEIAQRAKQDPVAHRLMSIPGVGPITATAIVALAPAPEAFTAARHFAAWLGLTPLQKSTGGKQKLGAISKMGERTLRRLLIIGASAVVRQAGIRGAPAGSWLAQMLARKPTMLVTVALANKTARIVWALLARGGLYRAPQVVG